MLGAALLVGLALATPPAVAFRVPTGKGAGVPAVDSATVWVPNTQAGTVSRVSVRGRKVTATIKLGTPALAGGYLDSAAVAGGSVWVARDLANEIDRIDPATNRVRARIKVSSRPGGLTTGGGYVWAFHFLGPQVTRIDERTGAKRVFTLPDVAGSGIVFAGDSVWVLSTRPPGLVELDPATGKELARVAIPLSPNLKHGVIDAWWVAAGAGSLWVAEANYDRVERVDAATAKVTASIPVPTAAPFGIAFYRGAAWVAGSGKVSRIDPATGKVASPLTLARGSAPVFTQVAAGPSGLWATDYDKGVLYRVLA
jgi:DNA-binding beta-propeller fold protein YncE